MKVPEIDQLPVTVNDPVYTVADARFALLRARLIKERC